MHGKNLSGEDWRRGGLFCGVADPGNFGWPGSDGKTKKSHKFKGKEARRQGCSSHQPRRNLSKKEQNGNNLMSVTKR